MPPSPPPRVLVTRSPEQSSALADRLRELGVEPVLIPTIEIVDPQSFAALDDALSRLAAFDWLVFTSANAVQAFIRRRALRAASSPQPGDDLPRIAAIGPATARALAQAGLQVALMPSQAVAESLTRELLPHARRPGGAPARFLLIRAEEAREYLPEELRAAGAEVTVAAGYRTVVPPASLERVRHLFSPADGVPHDERVMRSLAAVTFTSASTARNLFTLLEAAGCTLPPGVVRASIGPITSATLGELGYPPHVEAPQATVEALAASLIGYLRTREKGTS